MNKRSNNTGHYLTFAINEKRFAIPANSIDRVLNVVEVNQLPEMPEHLLGIINYHDELLPVINMHHLFGYETKDFELSDQLVIVNVSSGKMALFVNQVLDVLQILEDIIEDTEAFTNGKKMLLGIAKLGDGLILINDIENFLDNHELKAVQTALSASNNN